MEVWKDIEGYEGLYQISNHGRVKSLHHGKERILKPRKAGAGYRKYSLCKNGKVKQHYLHILVAIHFIPNPDNLPEVNHRDGVKTNCFDYNLEWCTHAENMKHAGETGLMNCKLNDIEVLEIRKIYAQGGITQRALSKKYNIALCVINGIILNKLWKGVKRNGI